ncbi:RtcB family protein [Tepidibacter hydrothermalis]|uniref:3'-phosphate/5'-hydroxy nucleic acid ligase n=1 Tax=Tepidibacter hydrothermalis TaxID=3036126 RepID=A0ABY8E741_9FIRM|nr:RtcB family protein [Tepidibacter hydrothermalis]WFD08702.1 RtcB family protein [Tepidibacter hydrothermalis]
MIEIQGKYNTAKVFTHNIGQEAVGQILNVLNRKEWQDSTIRIMPDTHAGKGCTIGTTMTLNNIVVPNLVGVDIGCGMTVAPLNQKTLDFNKLDNVIRNHVPAGTHIRKYNHEYVKLSKLKKLKCIAHVDLERAKKSIGTLGGGNHFIEVNQDNGDNLYLVVHSGSRHIGNQVAKYYQDIAIKNLSNNENYANRNITKTDKDLAFLTGEDFDNYLHDMNIIQEYASLNRKAIISVILKHLEINDTKDIFETIHNYIDVNDMLLRKGAISAKKDEKVIIPINMRDGSIIAVGKGNEDWNQSAPHGAGRLMSRGKAKESIDMNSYKDSMKNVWTTSVRESTIDEAPMAYKPIEEIIENTKDTIDIIDIIRPLYNFKA